VNGSRAAQSRGDAHRFAAVALLAGCSALASGCGGEVRAPRLVAAPPLPPSGIVLDLSPWLTPRTSHGSAARRDDPFGGPARARSVVLGDEPLALARGGATVELAGSLVPAGIAGVAAERWIGPLIVFDLTARAAVAIDAEFGDAELEAFEREHGPVPRDSFVLLRSGYAEQAAQLRDAASAFTTPRACPGFAPSVLRTLARERGVRALMTEAPRLTVAIDGGGSAAAALEQRQVLAVYEVLAPAELEPVGGTVVVAALPLAGSRSAPARVFAIVPP
jgi:kynurenine formamidase